MRVTPSPDDPPTDGGSLTDTSTGSASTGCSGTACGKQLLTAADLSYVGAFRLPATVSYAGQEWDCIRAFMPTAMTHRRVEGQLRLMLMTNFWDQTASGGPPPHALVELEVPSELEPSPEAVANAPVAAQMSFFPQTIYGDKAIQSGTGEPMPDPKDCRGIFWDQTSQRLYWTYGSLYPGWPFTPTNASIGYSVLDDAAHTITAVGSWSTGHSYKFTSGGMLDIPSWFVEQYLGGTQRLAARTDNLYSVVTFGPNSYGPTCVAFDPSLPGDAAHPHATEIPTTILEAHPYDGNDNSMSYPLSPFPWRNVSWSGGPDGHWNYLDYKYWGGFHHVFAEMWIDTEPTSATSGRHGLLGFSGSPVGDRLYDCGTDKAASGDSFIWIVNPDDLARVLNRELDPRSIQPTAFPWTWPTGPYVDPSTTNLFLPACHPENPADVQYHPDVTLTGGGRIASKGASSDSFVVIKAATYDRDTQRIYVYREGAVANDWRGAVFVYQVRP